tara:strand:- start:60 stop:755 length:696 start_codon:yes stop_codon:yes gene_type:complete
MNFNFNNNDKQRSEMGKKWLLIVLFLCNIISIKGQENEVGNWLIYIGNKDLNSSLNWHHEIQHRNYNIFGELEQLLLRTGIGYDIKENNNILLGYGFIDSRNRSEGTEEILKVNEHRIYQQFISKHAIGKIKIQHRYRFEQRFVEDDFKLRYRYFLSLNIPILKTNEKYYISAYNEIFINANDDKTFDRNRIYGGLGYVLNSNIKLELGYMNQIFQSSSRDQINLICFFNF